MIIQAKAYCGKNIYAIEDIKVDVNLTDEELFENVLHQMAVAWSSTDGFPHHKGAMARNGTVRRNSNNEHVYITGEGWGVVCMSENIRDQINECSKTGNYELLVKISAKWDSVWKNNL
jgi:hypothetical protein